MLVLDAVHISVGDFVQGAARRSILDVAPFCFSFHADYKLQLDCTDLSPIRVARDAQSPRFYSAGIAWESMPRSFDSLLVLRML